MHTRPITDNYVAEANLATALGMTDGQLRRMFIDTGNPVSLRAVRKAEALPDIYYHRRTLEAWIARHRFEKLCWN